MYFVVLILVVALAIGALVDITIADRWRIRYLNKVFWVILVFLFPFVGSILWFVTGRRYARMVDHGSFGDPRQRAEPAPAPRDTESELAALEREIIASQKEERIRRLEAELRARRGKEDSGD